MRKTSLPPTLADSLTVAVQCRASYGTATVRE